MLHEIQQKHLTRVPLPEQLRGDPLRTQFGRALHELGIEWIAEPCGRRRIQGLITGGLNSLDLLAVVGRHLYCSTAQAAITMFFCPLGDGG